MREVFIAPAEEPVTYHTLGISYDQEHDLLITMFGRNSGYVLLDRDRGKILPFSLETCGDNDWAVALSWDNGETWTIDKEIRLPKPESSHGMSGAGVFVGNTMFFPHPVGTADPEMTIRRGMVLLARLLIEGEKEDGFTTKYEPRFRVLATNKDEDVLFSSETIYLEKLEGTGYLSFTRPPAGAPYRREYDSDHRPTSDFERCRTHGFDSRDYDHGQNGPLLVAFGITRLADGNLLYASRYYGTDHHRGGNIFMTSTDEGKTWDFHDDHIPKKIDPLLFSNHGGGGNPQMSYAPDGSLYHITSEGWAGQPPSGGFFLARFQGFTIDCVEEPGQNTRGMITIDVSTITRIEEVFIARISVLESTNVEMENEATDRYSFSPDFTAVSFAYKKTADTVHLKLRIVLANHTNTHRPVFTPRVEL